MNNLAATFLGLIGTWARFRSVPKKVTAKRISMVRYRSVPNGLWYPIIALKQRQLFHLGYLAPSIKQAGRCEILKSRPPSYLWHGSYVTQRVTLMNTTDA